MGISQQTFYLSKKKYALARAERVARDENAKLKRLLVTNLSLDRHILQESVANRSTPQAAPLARLQLTYPLFLNHS
jgi:hypothetical protein